jgi:hypothetical protein
MHQSGVAGFQEIPPIFYYGFYLNEMIIIPVDQIQLPAGFGIKQHSPLLLFI